jgi:glycerophosphoryl diester phosphodiesterase
VIAHPCHLYAHRGASAELPENTLEAFRRGLERGATAIETDAHLTKDGHVVLSHDPAGGRMAGVPRAIRESTLEEVQRWDVGWGFVDAEGRRPFAGQGHRVPSLDEVLSELPDVPLNIDVKQRGPAMVDPLVELLRRHRAESRVTITSFDARTIRAVRRVGWKGAVGLGQADVIALLVLPAFVLRRLFRPGDAVQIPLRVSRIELATRARIERFHEIGLRVDYWVINDREVAGRLLDLGADGIMSDDPGALAPLFAAGG